MEPDPIPPKLRELKLRDYRPRSMLRAPAHQVPRARFPAVDVHNHLGRWLTPDWSAPDVGALIDLMDVCNVETIVNLDGRLPDELDANLERYDRAHPARFLTFAQGDWRVTAAEGFGEALAAQLRGAVARGARGMKIWKTLGLHLRDPQDALLMPGDARLTPLWEAAAEQDVPILIHVADPVAFFEPLDARNERLEELLEHPDWYFGDRSRFPAFDAIIDSFEALIDHNPQTTFIGAHVGCVAEDLAWVDRMLSSYPNFHADIAARIPELGRQPRAARRLLMAHPDRILFGTDEFPPRTETYTTHFRFLETADEHFPYVGDEDEIPAQGRWAVSGLELPEDVLRAVYGDNARRLLHLPGPSR